MAVHTLHSFIYMLFSRYWLRWGRCLCWC